ncbi:MAG TPA: NYN domain-containing protein [Actinopolymorphaceae bacterium]
MSSEPAGLEEPAEDESAAQDEHAAADSAEAPGEACQENSGDEQSGDEQSEAPAGPLPEAVRQRIVGLASDTLDDLSSDLVPVSLRPFLRFSPARRVRLAATPIAAAVDADDAFRERIAGRVRQALPELVEALQEGRRPAAVDPQDVAAVAYVLRPAGWTAIVDEVVTELQRHDVARALERESEITGRLREQLAAVQSSARQEKERLRAEIVALKEENANLRRTLHATRNRLRSAQQEAARHAERAEQARKAAADEIARGEAELRRLRARLAEAEAAASAARRTGRGERDLADARLRLLVDTVFDAARGLRRELGLPPVQVRPADTLTTASPPAEGPPQLAGPEGAVSLETLLGLPQVHLIVDGYNVTKTAWPALPLEMQRNRLVSGLGGLAAQTGAEITCVFDGAMLQTPPQLMVPRGVRVRFSSAGVSADEVIRQLAAAEPEGRPVVVVSSDREIADAVRRHGGRPVPAEALVRVLAR